jgi:superfamily I DNA/RNA helicase
MTFDLSDEQRLLADWDTGADGDLFAEACPGAGKTRAIVVRYLRLTVEEPRKGVALVSFTTAAVEEVTGRCGDRPDALRAPHFVGTFDGFINRYLTKPLYVCQYEQTPRFLESWDGIKGATFRLPGLGSLPGFELSWFALDDKLRASLVRDWIPGKPARSLQAVITSQRAAIEKQATAACRSLIARGLISCAASRALALGHLKNSNTAERFGRLLANRFREVIVDEAQDCGPEELLILDLLRRSGVKVVAVADMDQSIFEFRRAEPAGVRAFMDTLPGRLPMNGNYRSSPAICGLNNSLRSGSRQEAASGPHAACPIPVRLLEFSNSDQVADDVTRILDIHDVPRTDVVFLAHRRADAQKCAGQSPEDASRSTNAVLSIASAHVVLTTSDSTAKERLKAIHRVEGILQEIAGIEDPGDLDDRWLRDTAIRLAVSLDPAGTDPKPYAAQVRKYVEQVRWPAGITSRNDLGTTLRAPRDDQWPTAGTGGAPAFASATIHSAKGREFPGVVVILPKKPRADAGGLHVLDHWEQGIDSEFRRVLYVGTSRAQKLLILAVHSDYHDRVAALLKRDSVPYDLV